MLLEIDITVLAMRYIYITVTVLLELTSLVHPVERRFPVLAFLLEPLGVLHVVGQNAAAALRVAVADATEDVLDLGEDTTLGADEFLRTVLLQVRRRGRPRTSSWWRRGAPSPWRSSAPDA